MPRIYDAMVRMNDEDIRKEYITQMEIILNDDPNVRIAPRAPLPNTHE